MNRAQRLALLEQKRRPARGIVWRYGLPLDLDNPDGLQVLAILEAKHQAREGEQ